MDELHQNLPEKSDTRRKKKTLVQIIRPFIIFSYMKREMFNSGRRTVFSLLFQKQRVPDGN